MCPLRACERGSHFRVERCGDNVVRPLTFIAELFRDARPAGLEPTTSATLNIRCRLFVFLVGASARLLYARALRPLPRDDLAFALERADNVRAQAACTAPAIDPPPPASAATASPPVLR